MSPGKDMSSNLALGDGMWFWGPSRVSSELCELW